MLQRLNFNKQTACSFGQQCFIVLIITLLYSITESNISTAKAVEIDISKEQEPIGQKFKKIISYSIKTNDVNDADSKLKKFQAAAIFQKRNVLEKDIEVAEEEEEEEEEEDEVGINNISSMKREGKKPEPKIWDQWGLWSKCSVTCGIGKLTRWRHCIGGSCAYGEKEAQLKTCTFPAC